MVTPEERDEMAKILQLMNGISTDPEPTRHPPPGAAINSVLSNLDRVSNRVMDGMLTESASKPELVEALNTARLDNGVKIGRYQIQIKEDDRRIAGKQFFSIYNSLTNDTIADNISLYQTAWGAVQLLNRGRTANSKEVMNLFEQDAQYTSHKVDAKMFKQKSLTTKDQSKREIYESRYQASLDRCMSAKKAITTVVK